MSRWWCKEAQEQALQFRSLAESVCRVNLQYRGQKHLESAVLAERIEDIVSFVHPSAGKERAEKSTPAYGMAKYFTEEIFPDTNVEQQTTVGAGDQGMAGIPVHYYKITGGHIYFPSVYIVDECSAVDIVKLEIVMAVFRIGLIYIVCDQKDIPALRKFAENIMKILHVQDITGKILLVV